jgi:transcriptional regulator with XRE-family HTH domain
MTDPTIPVALSAFRILAKLERLGVTNAEVARRMGVSRSTVQRWKAGSDPRYQDGQSLFAILLEEEERIAD